MRQEPSFFQDSEPALVYIAKRLNEALELESLLNEAGIDYGVEPDRYRGGFVFQTERIGAFFYVSPQDEETARSFLLEHGYRPTDRETKGG